MKKFVVTLILFGSLSAVAAFAKDKEKDKAESAPEFTAEQQAEIFKLQVDMADEVLQAQPHTIAVQNLRNQIQQKISQVCDPAKYQVDWRSLKCTVLVKAEAAKPAEKPAEQK
jgi:hypothetical protein